MQRRGTLERSSPALADGRDSIYERLRHPAVMHVGVGQRQREGDALRIRDGAVAMARGLPSVGDLRR